MEMIQIKTNIRGMWFPEKPSFEKSYIAGRRTKDFTLCRPRLNFINVLSTAFTPVDPKSVKSH